MNQTAIDRGRSNRDALPSREAAIATCRAALAQGPVLVTGGPGVGKTWLGEHLARSEPALTWVSVDLAPAMTAEDFLRAASAALGLSPPPASAGLARLALASTLTEKTADGASFALIVDEAHLAGDELFEEIRVLSNRLGRRDGFAAIVILGQTPLARRLEGKGLAAFESRIAARVHLKPLEPDEAALWLKPEASLKEAFEDLHRMAAGNPRRLLRLSVSLLPPSESHSGAVATDLAAPRSLEPAPLVPTRPPLRVEEGLIEVGWEADPEADPVSTSALSPAPLASAELVRHEPVDDRYAALQAWDEWSRNQGRALDGDEIDEADELEADEDDFHVEIKPLEPTPTPAAATASDQPEASPLERREGVWADESESFAPYSQLFSRMKKVSEPS